MNGSKQHMLRVGTVESSKQVQRPQNNFTYSVQSTAESKYSLAVLTTSNIRKCDEVQPTMLFFNCVDHFMHLLYFIQAFNMRKHFFNDEETGFFKTQKREGAAPNPMTGL